MNVLRVVVCSLLLAPGLTGLLPAARASSHKHFPFIENRGQWEQGFSYQLKLRWGQLYFFDDRILFDTWDQEAYHKAMQCVHRRGGCKDNLPLLQKHAFEVRFVNTSPDKRWINGAASSHYYNYYLGDDPQKWKTGIPGLEHITCTNIWKGINLVYYTRNGILKYDLEIQPDASPGQIELEYAGVDRIRISNGNLLIETAAGTIEERAPVAWQDINGERISVPCRYRLSDNRLTFDLGKEYRPEWPLTIDPQIIFSTYSGSTGDNWGATATYDAKGNAYLGGINFATGYPTTIGAYQTNYVGIVDVTITKFNPSGTQALYSTYIGGSQTEIPYSMVVDQEDNLIVMGSTGSSNFPVTNNAYDQTFDGGTTARFWVSSRGQYLANYPQGSDLFVSKFSSSGTSLLSSTFLGGDQNEGFNSDGELTHNYGDAFRGEVIADETGAVYVIGTTRSTNLPVINAWQTNYGGGTQDACFFKLNSTLSSLLCCSYFGGTGGDNGLGMQLGPDHTLYFCGGTMSSDIPGTRGVQAQHAGGVDGYIAKINRNGGAPVLYTFLGTSSYDQCYFVQTDNEGNIYALGQTAGNYPVSAGNNPSIYSRPRGTLFFHSLNAGLSATRWSTRFGSTAAGNTLVPSAFLVDYCGYISFSLWAGDSNHPHQSSTSGLPVSPDAFQPLTTGSDFYLGVFSENFSALHYATFFGGAEASEHVDGGTSRFDKKGIIYQAVCAGCSDTPDDMPVTQGVWSATNNSNNCNAAVFKFDLSEYSALIGDPNPSRACRNQDVRFTNASTGESTYTWYFGDGNTSGEKNPRHRYTGTGTFRVMLVARNNGHCNPTDTAYLDVVVTTLPEITTQQVDSVCRGEPVQLYAEGGENYTWLPQSGLPSDQQNLQTPIVSPPATTVYTVLSSNDCGTDTATLLVPVIDFSATIITNGSEICLGENIILSASPAETYNWQPENLTDTPHQATASFRPEDSFYVYLSATNERNCIATDSLFVRVIPVPVARAGLDTTICYGSNVRLSGIGGSDDTWYIEGNASPFSTNTVIVAPEETTSYVLVSENRCGTDRDTVRIDVSRVYGSAGPGGVFCAYTPLRVYSAGGSRYRWIPSRDFSDPASPSPLLSPRPDVQYSVVVRNELGCETTVELPVSTYPVSRIAAGKDQIIRFDETAELQASGDPGIYAWTPPEGLTCTTCLSTLAKADTTTLYTITLTDEYGCVYTDDMLVIVEGALYLPNAFTPNGDGMNDIFVPASVDVVDFRMEIYDRWGELLFISEDARQGWNGKVNGTVAQNDVYIFRVSYRLNSGREGTVLGNVTLIR